MSKYKVGDWVVITKSPFNWIDEMNKFDGKCVQITNIFKGSSVRNSGLGCRIMFKKDGNYSWEEDDGHFRTATEEEIEKATGKKIINYEISEIISMNKIKEVLEKIYNNSELRRSIVPLFIGNPGIGKTVLIEEFAKSKKVKLVELITSQMSPFEVSGIAFPDKEAKKMMYYNFDKLENLKKGDILFFDELLNGNPVVLNACLTLLEQRRFISGKALPDIMIVAAANPQGMTPLTPQIKERFVWYTINFDHDMWKDYMFKKYQLPKNITSKLCDLIIGEDFSANNFNTPRSLDKAVNMILNDVPTPYKGLIYPILNTLIKNPSKQRIKLSEDRFLEVNETISWLELIKIKNGIIKK